MAYDEGTRFVAATAHQNETYPDVTPDVIRTATARLAQQLRDLKVPLTVFACGEVMAHPELETALQGGQLLTVADRQQYMLIEMPHGLYVDLRYTIERLKEAGIRPILAHAERCEELLHDSHEIESLIQTGCLVQVNAGSITDPRDGRDQRALKDWFQRGIAHLLGSDGHSPNRRQPRMKAAYEQVVRWCGHPIADRVASTHGLAILQGLRLRIPTPRPKTTKWYSALWS